MSFVVDQFLSKQSDNKLLEAIVRLEAAILKNIEAQPEDIVLLQSNNNNLSSNVADGVVILASAPCPANHTIKITDWNINFTTAAGTVRAVVLDANNQEVNNVLRDVNSSTNGTGSSVLQNGQRLAIVGQNPGAGVFGCYFSGEKKRLRSSL